MAKSYEIYYAVIFFCILWFFVGLYVCVGECYALVKIFSNPLVTTGEFKEVKINTVNPTYRVMYDVDNKKYEFDSKLIGLRGRIDQFQSVEVICNQQNPSIAKVNSFVELFGRLIAFGIPFLISPFAFRAAIKHKNWLLNRPGGMWPT